MSRIILYNVTGDSASWINEFDQCNDNNNDVVEDEEIQIQCLNIDDSQNYNIQIIHANDVQEFRKDSKVSFSTLKADAGNKFGDIIGPFFISFQRSDNSNLVLKNLELSREEIFLIRFYWDIVPILKTHLKSGEETNYNVLIKKFGVKPNTLIQKLNDCRRAILEPLVAYHLMLQSDGMNYDQIENQLKSCKAPEIDNHLQVSSTFFTGIINKVGDNSVSTEVFGDIESIQGFVSSDEKAKNNIELLRAELDEISKSREETKNITSNKNRQNIIDKIENFSSSFEDLISYAATKT